MHEISENLTDSVRGALRITTKAFDGEINDIISAAQKDLLIGGVAESHVYDDSDPLIKRAIITYAKAEFGENADADKYRAAYAAIRLRLQVSGDYGGYDE